MVKCRVQADSSDLNQIGALMTGLVASVNALIGHKVPSGDKVDDYRGHEDADDRLCAMRRHHLSQLPCIRTTASSRGASP